MCDNTCKECNYCKCALCKKDLRGSVAVKIRSEYICIECDISGNNRCKACDLLMGVNDFFCKECGYDQGN